MKHLKLDYKQQVHQKVFISLLRFRNLLPKISSIGFLRNLLP